MNVQFFFNSVKDLWGTCIGPISVKLAYVHVWALFRLGFTYSEHNNIILCGPFFFYSVNLENRIRKGWNRSQHVPTHLHGGGGRERIQQPSGRYLYQILA